MSLMHYLMIVHRNTGFLLFDKKFSQAFHDLSAELLSNLMIALTDFSKMMKIGDLSSFMTHEYKMTISLNQNISVVIVSDNNDYDELAKNLALQISKEFIALYNVPDTFVEVSIYKSFSEIVDEIISKFEWKNVIDYKIKREYINGMVFFDLQKMDYYKFSSTQQFNAEVLIERALKATNEKLNELTLTEGDENYYIYKIGDFGGVLLIDSKCPQGSIERFQKTFSFIVNNLNTSFSIKPELTQAALSIFGESIVASVTKVSNKPIREILAQIPEDFTTLENLRRMELRGVLNHRK